MDSVSETQNLKHVLLHPSLVASLLFHLFLCIACPRAQLSFLFAFRLSLGLVLLCLLVLLAGEVPLLLLCAALKCRTSLLLLVLPLRQSSLLLFCFCSLLHCLMCCFGRYEPTRSGRPWSSHTGFSDLCGRFGSSSSCCSSSWCCCSSCLVCSFLCGCLAVLFFFAVVFCV